MIPIQYRDSKNTDREIFIEMKTPPLLHGLHLKRRAASRPAWHLRY